MKAMDFLDTLFFDPDLTLRDMHKGLTNQNFLLKMNQETYVPVSYTHLLLHGGHILTLCTQLPQHTFTVRRLCRTQLQKQKDKQQYNTQN